MEKKLKENSIMYKAKEIHSDCLIEVPKGAIILFPPTIERAKEWAKSYLNNHSYAVENCTFIKRHSSVYAICHIKIVNGIKRWEKARCSKTDSFDFEVGKAIALSRLLSDDLPDFI